VQQQRGNLTADRQRIRARSRRSRRRIRDQPPGEGGSDEQHGHEQQATAQEHGSEEPILLLPYPVPHHADEPQEGNASEWHQVQRDDNRAAASGIRQPTTGLAGISGYRDDDQDEGNA
jgi:hypothetical protein